MSSVEESKRALILAGLLVAGVWGVLGARSLWFDELFAWKVASQPWREVVRYVQDHDAHPPLYYALLKAWKSLFGDSERALRALSAVLAVLSLAVLRAVARVRVGERAGAVGVLALVASPLFLQVSVEATRSALLALTYLLAARATLQVLEGRRSARLQLALAATALLYTHALGAVLAGSLVLFSAWQGRLSGLRSVAGPLAVSALAFVPWLPVLLHHLQAGRFDPPWRPALPPTLPLQVVHVIGFGGRTLGTAGYFSLSSAPAWLEGVLAVPVLVVLAAAFSATWKRDRALGRLAACAVLVPAALLLAASVWKQSMVAYPRYFAFTLPLLALCVGSLGATPLTRGWRATVVVCGAAVVGLALASLASLAAKPTEGEGDRRALAAELTRRLRPVDVVLVSRWESVGLDYYVPALRGVAVRLASEWTAEGLAEVRTQVHEASAAGRVWVVQGFPFPPGAFEAVYRQLAATHRVSYFGEFDGVRLTLFVRRSGSP